VRSALADLPGPGRPGAFGRLKWALFGIPAGSSAGPLGYEDNGPAIRERLRTIGEAFLEGYHAALLDDDPERLAARIDAIVPAEFRGFACEGAGMGLAVGDCLAPWRPPRLRRFAEGPGRHQAWIVHVGAGWAYARLPVGVERAARRLDPAGRWFAVDGYGFHQGFFRGPRYIEGHEPPRRLSPFGCCAFDHGLGRSLWFVKAGHPERLAAAVAAFPPERQPRLWGGIGLAAAYAGGVEQAALESLRAQSGRFLPELRVGVALAAATRARAGNPAEWTNRAAVLLCDASADRLAAVVEATGNRLADRPDLPAYGVWRERIRHELIPT
jgi:hypothetical protein